MEFPNLGDSIGPMDCRPACAACCIAPSISSPIPGMPLGKRADVPCVQLDERSRCRLFGRPERPTVCLGLKPSQEMCGNEREHALAFLRRLETSTSP
jgi:Fe-S-cluster containining protein